MLVKRKQHDTKPLEVTCTTNKRPVPLSGCTVVFNMRPKVLGTGQTIVRGECEIVDAAKGRVRYSWKSPLAGPANLAAEESIDVGALGPGTYFYVVAALNAIGEGLPCDPVGATVIDAATPVGSSVDVMWDAVDDAVTYRVYRALTVDGEYGLVGETTALALNDPGGVTGASQPLVADESGETSHAGVHRCEFEVTFSDLSVETFPSDDYLDLEFVGDLG